MQLVALQNYLFHTLNLKKKSVMTSSIIFQKRNKKSNSKTIYGISKGYKQFQQFIFMFIRWHKPLTIQFFVFALQTQ